MACSLLYLACFSIGLNMVPQVHARECFKRNARNSIMDMLMVFYWISAILVTLAFPLVLEQLRQFLFLAFGACAIVVLFITNAKVCENKAMCNSST